jgi:enoyl-CoA hydratase/carnithine racemase
VVESADGVSTVPGVTLATDAGLGVITIDRPEVRNALGLATVAELDAALDDALAADVAVLVLKGGGDRAFVSGGDLKELAAIRTHDDAVAMACTVRRLLDRVADFPVPVIAALNGHALGGGAEVAIAADIRIAADDVKIGFNQVTLGIMPAWGGAERLAQVVGRGRAMLAIATGQLYDAPAAHELGLLDLVVPRDSFDVEWRALARQLADTAPGATRAIKRVLGAAVPTHRPDLEADAAAEFARLWTADAHWDAVEALERKRRSS